ncbi:MAG: hypothetical protein IJK23_05690 [Clostridia bacterium]|nr:hypothetical protein [Clostridia bacterium]
MFEIRITAPELSEALLALAEALKFSGTPFSMTTQTAVKPAEEEPAEEPAKKTRKKAKAENPTASSAADAAQPPATAEPASVGTPAAAADKMPSLDDIATAGAALIDAGKLNEMMEVLAKYGAETIFEIQPAQFPAFVADLRALGAKI